MKTLFPSDATASLRKKLLVATFLFSGTTFVNAQQLADTTKVNALEEVLVSAVRVTKKTPVTFSNLSKSEIKSRNLGQDIPVIMNYLPSVVTTSDAGNGVGYTGFRVRGIKNVNVTINGIPYTESEDQGTYFVDLPDFTSSVESLQLQRGVGTSTNGASAFGASLNLLTDSYSKESKGEFSNSFGSFDTHKHTLKFSSGLLNNNFELAGRVSSINSHGYIDRASSDLKSYFLQATYVGKTTLIKALLFGGKEKTYQSWNGIDSETIKTDRTFNSSGLYYDDAGNVQFYDNQTDNYQQHHFQLHWNEKISEKWTTNLAVHYTKGNGYYQNYEDDTTFLKYNLTPVGTEETTDLVNQKWLDNDLYGTTFSATYKNEKLQVIFGGGWNKFLGDHFGKVKWVALPVVNPLQGNYYEDTAAKTDGNVFLKANYQITSKINLFGDLQYRRVNYKADGVQPQYVDDTFKFLNPKAGITYDLNAQNALYLSYAKANREPNRTDYENGNPKPEKLDDYELGWRHLSAKVKWNANVYYMAYKNQLILTGNLDDVGNPIRSNSEKSYRLGFEVDANIALTKRLTVSPNISLSENKNIDLNVNGENAGTKDIAYSPSLVAGNILTYKPLEKLQISWLFKFVGEQYLNNIELPDAKLPDYAVHDLNIAYEIKPKSVFKSIVFTGLVNNVLDKQYISNGYMYDVYPYYYPQAGTNFLAGLTLNF
ncbi:TonB-dependent receptor [Flavobacterium sp.]|uniref:TonB-dependent receptor n=1 Tax=Flavobacterium sp. TaxID=239 RepID=UPI002623ADF2|nr:TonB-dependent receptor [Flavobacterium sp.]